MRGKHHTKIPPRCTRRITPAHAGKTSACPDLRKRKPDHPRACGENFFGNQPIIDCHGSPPRMRGKLEYQSGELKNLRITPAHAGKTLFRRRACGVNKDHPRACGENGAEPCFVGKCDGSPPRMRGKLNKTFFNRFDIRITPAHAGKTKIAPHISHTNTDHPRACGENIPTEEILWTFDGSPPRMRGKQLGDLSRQVAQRITPAHAGKT